MKAGERQRIAKALPDAPGVYFFKDQGGKVLYVGKAASLRRRVGSYFVKSGNNKTEVLINEAETVDWLETSTAIEALILEAKLIKKHQPLYNARTKDDTSFWYVEITKEEYPRVLMVRGKDIVGRSGVTYGPFTNASDLRAALHIVRKIFPFSTHAPSEVGKARRPCFNAQIDLCPGICVGRMGKKEYARIIRNIKLFLSGNKQKLVAQLERDMKKAAKELEFEEAARLKKQLFALNHIQDTALITKDTKPMAPGSGVRIEGYDISNISGSFPVGAMVVFIDGRPAKAEYKKFKIRTIDQSDDTGMIREMLERRFGNSWPLPDLLLIDGGKGQVNTARKVVEASGLRIPVVGIAKGPTRKKNEFVGKVPKNTDEETLIRVRDEAHRFAISYHKQVRGKEFIKR